MIATANKSMERCFRMLREKIHPDWIIARLETWSSKVILVDAGRETVALIIGMNVKSPLRENEDVTF